MGEPMKIAHLAWCMIELCGHEMRSDGSSHGGIEIKYIGLRTGENRVKNC